MKEENGFGGQMQRKVLIVEDEPDIALLVKNNLSDINCDADVASNGADAQALFAKNDYQLIVLDLMLPDTDGLTLCRHFRAAEGYVPILMLTAKSSELDRVLGLEMGADDYLTKPFSIPELIARIKALFRRVEAFSTKPESTKAGEIISCQDMRIDIDRRQVTLKGKAVDLTAREFELLLFFARHPGRVYNRMQLLDQVWGYNHDGYEHTVNSHINRLRAKIEEDPSSPTYVHTVWGVGYKFNDACGE